tara:strand:+ start:1622 stop:2014 length:393 start_codon:yes stop_codon:yes gene_type:complete
MSGSVPKCVVCGASQGTEFPIWPKSEGYQFGQICAACDDGIVEGAVLVIEPDRSEDIAITVCSDCYCAAANGLDSIDVWDERRAEIAAGFNEVGHIVIDVEDEGHFSRSRCQVCDTCLGGTRLRAWVQAT